MSSPVNEILKSFELGVDTEGVKLLIELISAFAGDGALERLENLGKLRDRCVDEDGNDILLRLSCP